MRTDTDTVSTDSTVAGRTANPRTPRTPRTDVVPPTDTPTDTVDTTYGHSKGKKESVPEYFTRIRERSLKLLQLIRKASAPTIVDILGTGDVFTPERINQVNTLASEYRALCDTLDKAPSVWSCSAVLKDGRTTTINARTFASAIRREDGILRADFK